MLFCILECVLSTAMQSNQQPEPTALEIQNSVIDSHEGNRTIFYALKTTVTTFDGVIKYDKVPINEGNAFIGQTGIFVAPRSGYYVFTISALAAHAPQGPTSVSVLKIRSELCNVSNVFFVLGAVTLDRGSSSSRPSENGEHTTEGSAMRIPSEDEVSTEATKVD